MTDQHTPSPSAAERIREKIDDILCNVDEDNGDTSLDPGIEFAEMLLCSILGVDPDDVTWDAATETLDGDTSQELCSILEVGFGEDFHNKLSSAPSAAAEGKVGEALDDYRRGQRDALNAVLSLNPAAAAKIAHWAEKDADPYGRFPFDVALWVSEVATQLGFETLEGDGPERFRIPPSSSSGTHGARTPAVAISVFAGRDLTREEHDHVQRLAEDIRKRLAEGGAS